VVGELKERELSKEVHEHKLGMVCIKKLKRLKGMLVESKGQDRDN